MNRFRERFSRTRVNVVQPGVVNTDELLERIKNDARTGWSFETIGTYTVRSSNLTMYQLLKEHFNRLRWTLIYNSDVDYTRWHDNYVDWLTNNRGCDLTKEYMGYLLDVNVFSPSRSHLHDIVEWMMKRYHPRDPDDKYQTIKTRIEQLEMEANNRHTQLDREHEIKLRMFNTSHDQEALIKRLTRELVNIRKQIRTLTTHLDDFSLDRCWITGLGVEQPDDDSVIPGSRYIIEHYLQDLPILDGVIPVHLKVYVNSLDRRRHYKTKPVPIVNPTIRHILDIITQYTTSHPLFPNTYSRYVTTHICDRNHKRSLCIEIDHFGLA